MKKLFARTTICLRICVSFICGTLIADRQTLRQELIRLHVVANSDSPEDQTLKLQIRDAVAVCLQDDLEKITDVEAAKAYLQEKLPYICHVAGQTLRTLGCEDTVKVSLEQEPFGTRIYDTFSLPAGVYHALRIVIGEGEGKNWWCVVFPGLCIPVASSEVAEMAAGAGFSDSLNRTLTGEAGYELRFGLLDAMGKLENILFEG